MRLILLSLSQPMEFENITIDIVVTIRFRIFCIALNIRRSLERKERISSKRNGAIVAVAIMMMTMTYPMMVMLVDDIDDTRNSALYVNSSSIRIPENEAIPLFTCFSTSNNKFWSLLKINEQYYLQCKIRNNIFMEKYYFALNILRR